MNTKYCGENYHDALTDHDIRKNESVPVSTDDNEESDEERNDDTIADLVDGINLSELSAGTTFQIKSDRSNKHPDDVQAYFGNEEILKYVRFDCMDLCSDDEEGRPGAPGDTPFERIASKMKNVTADGSVKKRVVRKGDKRGEKVPKGALVTIHYNAYLEYGDEPFDSTNLRGGPQKYRLGSGSLLMGLEIAVETMHRNEVSQFLVEPELAWGKLGCPPRIPPNAKALFEVQLMDFIDSGGTANFDAMTPEEQKNADFPVALRAAKGLHLQGNDLFRNHSLGQAVKRYKKAVSILESCVAVKNEEEERELNILLVRLYVNLGITYNIMKHPGQTCIFTKKALALDPTNVKALYNRGKALLMLNDFRESGRFLRAAQRLDPKNEDVNKELKKLEDKHAANLEIEQDMCRRMFPGNSNSAFVSSEKKEKKTKAPVSDKFCETVKEDLKEFKNGDEKNQFNLPSGLTAAEEEFIRDEATSLGLRVVSHLGKITISK